MELIAFCLVGGVAYADGRECTHYVLLAPCEYEDGLNCYWYALSAGNGLGRSFVDVDGLLFAWDGEAE